MSIGIFHLSISIILISWKVSTLTNLSFSSKWYKARNPHIWHLNRLLGCCTQIFYLYLQNICLQSTPWIGVESLLVHTHFMNLVLLIKLLHMIKYSFLWSNEECINLFGLELWARDVKLHDFGQIDEMNNESPHYHTKNLVALTCLEGLWWIFLFSIPTFEGKVVSTHKFLDDGSQTYYLDRGRRPVHRLTPKEDQNRNFQIFSIPPTREGYIWIYY